MASLAIPWALGAALQLAASDMPTRLFWFRFHVVWQLPTATAALWFALDYADFPVTRRALGLLAVPPLVVLGLVATDPAHHLMWKTFSFDGSLRPVPGIANVIAISYSLLVVLATLAIFLWLFLTSRLHRPSAALCLAGQLVAEVAYALDSAEANPFVPLDLSVLSFPVSVAIYAFALTRFRIFDLVPVARSTVVDQMGQAMVVLNQEQEIVDLNPAAERMLAVSALRARGKPLREILANCPELGRAPDQLDAVQAETTFGEGDALRRYVVHYSPLLHRHGLIVGSVMLLRDVTRERATQVCLVEQQRALATLRERDRVARELHDSLGQLLGYVKMQAQAARELLARGKTAEANGCLGQLVAVVQNAHLEVRDYIFSARAGASGDSAFVPTLEGFLHRFRLNHGIAASLEVAPHLRNLALDRPVTTQLLRVIQEALTNVRKHAAARTVRVVLSTREDCFVATVQDDGAGFDPLLFETGGQKFGLGVMRERAREVGASLRIDSAPGRGTEIVIRLPLSKVHHEALVS